MYILMDYHTTCEVCGKRIHGVVARHVMDNDSAMLGNVINSMADSVDATNAKIGLKKQVEGKQWSKLNFSNGDSKQRCPYCGAHQSWENLPKPVEPEKPGAKGHLTGKIAGTVFLGFIGGTIGMVAGLFIMIFTNTLGLIISAIIGLVLGLACGVWMGNLDDQEKVEKYPQEVEAYKAYVKEYDAYQESLRTRRVRYEPVVEIDSVRVSRYSDETTEAHWPGLRRML